VLVLLINSFVDLVRTELEMSVVLDTRVDCRHKSLDVVKANHVECCKCDARR
jgi:hypothetical protein